MIDIDNNNKESPAHATPTSMPPCCHGQMYRPIPRQMYRPIPRQMYRPIPRQLYRPIPRQMYRPIPRQMYRPIPTQKYRPIPRRKYRPIHRQKYRPIPRQMYRHALSVDMRIHIDMCTGMHTDIHMDMCRHVVDLCLRYIFPRRLDLPVVYGRHQLPLHHASSQPRGTLYSRVAASPAVARARCRRRPRMLQSVI